jgi:hypothetical protein
LNLIERAKNILLTPKTEWDVIAGETAVPMTLVVGYVLPLAAIAAIAGFISSAVIGTSLPFGGTFRMPMTWALAMLVYGLVMSVVACFVVGFIIDLLAPTFGGTKNYNAAFSVAVYAYTAGWVGALFRVIPYLGWLLAFLVSLYGIYLLYLGLPKLMKNPVDKSVGYTALVIVVAIVVGFVIAIVGGMITGPAMMAGMAMGGGPGMGMHARPGVTYDKDSKLGQLQEFGKKMEEANKKMEEAQKSGDQSKQAAAAMGALGTILSGGKGVDPVQLDVLKPMLPDSVGGLPKTASSSDRSGVAGLMVAKVANTYSDNQGKRIELEVMDTGGAAGLVGLAGWAALGSQSETENESRIERTRKEGSRIVHEEISKTGGTNNFTLVLADRFVVSAKGNGVGIDALKSAVGGLDLGKLESMK